MLLLTVSFSFSIAGEFGLFKVAPTVGLIFPETDWRMGPQLGAKIYSGSLMEREIGLFPFINYWSSKYKWENTFGGNEDLVLKMSNISFGVDCRYKLDKYVDGLYSEAGKQDFLLIFYQ